MERELDYHAALAALDWQIELGADEAIAEAPVNRYEAVAEATARPAPPAVAAKAAPTAFAAPVVEEGPDPVEEARAMAGAARDLAGLREALERYDHCELKKGARNLVFGDGHPQARLMILGEAPGRDEDIEGRPFVGRAGQLLDRMFAAIGYGRAAPDTEAAVYITNVLPWRPPQNRDPSPAEIQMMLPFVERHVALVDPDVLILMGNTPCAAALGKRGITRIRGHWAEAFGRPVLPMFHPAYLLRTPSAKRETWADLLEVQARLRSKR
ncbi:uracil-DNA glycosylase [Thioclava sp. BHET1]|nr:uracil-DNA glycosylase [Thioclava sp. BHET1]